ncbi:MAG TPA: MbtH family NRPS accessory protein [Steroidobacteraceae bacterium]|nr:MbtH family NRPS accessory protein [Steroidobacteraceae bacterium]
MNDDELLADDWIVLINDEEQYSLWPASNAIPAGWRAVGPRGSKAETLAYVEMHWTDMRPKSLRCVFQQRSSDSPDGQ